MSRKDPNKDLRQTTGAFSQWLQRLCPNHSEMAKIPFYLNSGGGTSVTKDW